MSYSNRFWRTLPNSNALSYVANAQAYTAIADFKTFVATAPSGALGFFNADTGALRVAATPAAAGDRYFFAVNRAGTIETSPIITHGSTTSSKNIYVAPVKPVWTIDTTVTTALTEGQILEITIIDQTTAFQPYPQQRFQYVTPAGGATLLVGVTALVAKINNLRDPQNVNGQKIATAAIVATDNITVTADYFGSNIKVMTGYQLSAISTTTNTTKFSVGSGVPAHVKLYQQSSDIMKGVIHLYDGNNTALPADFGLPADQINYAGAYATYQFINHNQEISPTPVERHFREQQVLLFVEDGATDPIAAINTILGL